MKKRAYQITDEAALLRQYPQFFKQTPDHAKIKKALSLGIKLEGVELIATPIEEFIAQSKGA